MVKLNDENKPDDLVYHFKNESASKRFDDFDKGIKYLEKIKSGDKKLEEAKKYQNVFKSNLNEIKRRKYKSKRQKGALNQKGKKVLY